MARGHTRSQDVLFLDVLVYLTPRGSPELITRPDYFTVCCVNRAYPTIPDLSLFRPWILPLLIPHCLSWIDTIVRQYWTEILRLCLLSYATSIFSTVPDCTQLSFNILLSWIPGLAHFFPFLRLPLSLAILYSLNLINHSLILIHFSLNIHTILILLLY